MEDPTDRLYLYTISAQVALQNQAIPQAESLFKAAVTHFAEIPTILGAILDHVCSSLSNNACVEGDGQVRVSEETLVPFCRYFLAALRTSDVLHSSILCTW